MPWRTSADGDHSAGRRAQDFGLRPERSNRLPATVQAFQLHLRSRPGFAAHGPGFDEGGCRRSLALATAIVARPRHFSRSSCGRPAAEPARFGPDVTLADRLDRCCGSPVFQRHHPSAVDALDHAGPVWIPDHAADQVDRRAYGFGLGGNGAALSSSRWVGLATNAVPSGSRRGASLIGASVGGGAVLLA